MLSKPELVYIIVYGVQINCLICFLPISVVLIVVLYLTTINLIKFQDLIIFNSQKRKSYDFFVFMKPSNRSLDDER